MDHEAYRKVISDLLIQRDQEIEDIARKQRTVQVLDAAIAHLRTLVDEPDPQQFEGGLADAIRSMLGTMGAVGGLSPRQIRDTLERLGYKHKSPNVLAAIHGVLKRMEESGELLSADSQQQGKVYLPGSRFRRADFIFRRPEYTNLPPHLQSTTGVGEPPLSLREKDAKTSTGEIDAITSMKARKKGEK